MTQPISITVTVNEKVYKRAVEPRLLLSDFLRHELGAPGDDRLCGLRQDREDDGEQEARRDNGQLVGQDLPQDDA